MPLYEFECEEHGTFEKKCKMGVSEETCPICEKPCQKIISKVSFAMGNSTYNVPRTTDIAVGKATEKSWRNFYDTKAKRDKERGS
jgi:putative FmdB family regulatory protein